MTYCTKPNNTILKFSIATLRELLTLQLELEKTPWFGELKLKKILELHTQMC